jgi:hypothetical protein
MSSKRLLEMEVDKVTMKEQILSNIFQTSYSITEWKYSSKVEFEGLILFSQYFHGSTYQSFSMVYK